MVLIDYLYQSKKKHSIRNLSFYLYSNSFASFLSQMFELLHSSLYLSSSLWYNRNGWLGIKHQVTYLSTLQGSRQDKKNQEI